MVDNKKNDGSSGEFDDINFDDFSDDFDEAQLEEEAALSDLPEEDFSDENFGDDDWEDDGLDENGEIAADPNLITEGKSKGGGLSFNAMVMIGAFVVGAGVLAANVMLKSGSQSSGGSSMFQSMLNIGGVMDGDFFGSKSDTTAEEDAAQQEQAQNEGFLNNPESLDPNANPPQPTPIAPPDELASDNQPLTPMPDAAEAPAPGTPAAEMPRGPDEGAPESNVAVAELPADTQTPPASVIEETPVEPSSAEDILKKAMENREQKAAPVEETAAPAEPPVETIDTPAPATVAEAEPAPAPEPAPVSEPEPAPAAAEPAQPTVSPEIVAENTKALAAVDGRMEELFKRMEQIEAEIGTVKDSKQTDTQALEQTIETLKAEIAALKNRPAPAAEPESTKKPVPVEEEVSAEEPAPEVVEEAPKPVVKKASKPKAAKKPAATAQATGRWELRAAQPGRAWVSRPGERDMQSVEVGQTLSGIGRVTAILYQNGRWTVQGTSGQINQ